MKTLSALRKCLKRWRHPVQLLDLTRTAPVSATFGLDRGTAIDRRYIESFLGGQRGFITGRVLEVAEDTYARRFASTGVQQIDILNPAVATEPRHVVCDLTQVEDVPQGVYDCFICTQTLNFIFDVQAAIAGAWRLLKPGGRFLVTVAGLSQVSRYDMDRWGDYWRFTNLSLQRLLEHQFGSDVQIISFGNALAATAFLQGLSVEDLPDTCLLDQHDPDYQIIIAGIATKREIP